MSKYLTVALVLLLAVSAAGKKKPRTPDPVLCNIKTVFIEGNNSSAYQLRRHDWSYFTKMVVVNSAEQADAILEVSETNKPADPNNRWSSATTTVSVQLKDKSGKQLWFGETQVLPLDVARDFKNAAACGVK